MTPPPDGFCHATLGRGPPPPALGATGPGFLQDSIKFSKDKCYVDWGKTENFIFNIVIKLHHRARTLCFHLISTSECKYFVGAETARCPSPDSAEPGQREPLLPSAGEACKSHWGLHLCFLAPFRVQVLILNVSVTTAPPRGKDCFLTEAPRGPSPSHQHPATPRKDSSAQRPKGGGG